MSCDIFTKAYAEEYVDIQHARKGKATLADRRRWYQEGLSKGAARYRDARITAREDAEPTDAELTEAMAS